MGKLVEAIVRGPENFFDGQRLYAPGQRVMVDSDFVSTEDTVTKTIKVKLDKPAMVDGKLVRYADEEVEVRTKFRPVDGGSLIAEQPLTIPEVATKKPDRLNVNDFLKGGADDIEEAIANGSVDEFLDVIEQAEIGGKGRKGVKAAITARRAAQ